MNKLRRRALIGGAVSGTALLAGAAMLHSSSPDWVLPAGGLERIPAGPGGRRQPLLFERWPTLADSLPWLSLGLFPTPVTRLSAMEQVIGFDGQLWLKREDLCCPLYGGNKVRKMEFLVADALAHGADTLISVGGIGSHQCCATGRFAQWFGLDHYAAMFPQPVTEHVRQNLRYNAWTGTRFLYSSGYASTVRTVIDKFRALRREGRKPYVVYVGASTPLGILGFVDMMLELKGQIEGGLLPKPDRIYTAAGSCGTIAGLLLGAQLAELQDIELVGVRITDRAGANAVVLDYLTDAAAHNLNRIDPTIPCANVPWSQMHFNHDHFGGTYGIPTREGVAAIQLLEQSGISLEATYTAKTMAAVLTDARKPENKGKKLMMLHTYNGVPYPDDLPDARSLPEELQWAFQAPVVEPVLPG